MWTRKASSIARYKKLPQKRRLGKSHIESRYNLPCLCRAGLGGLSPLRTFFLFLFTVKGCENFVCIDGIWKLRHPHCLYPVKSDISGLLTLNYPNVCTEEPETQTSAFCAEHSELAKEKNIPTNLRAFIHDYCRVPRNTDGIYTFIILLLRCCFFKLVLSCRSSWHCTPSCVASTELHLVTVMRVDQQ